jgi:hypothetical protein
LWSFGTTFPILVRVTKKNLATLFAGEMALITKKISADRIGGLLANVSIEGRVTRGVCEKFAKNVAQPKFWSKLIHNFNGAKGRP